MEHHYTARHRAIIALLALLPGVASAQNSYSFEAATAPYTEITTPTPFVPDADGAQLITELYGEVFWFYGVPTTFSSLDPLYPFDTGYIILEIGDDIVAIDAVNQPLEAVDASSSVTYSITGTPGNKELVVQWKNWRIEGDTVSNYLNWQIAIDQASGVVEVRYGPNSGSAVGYTDLTGPYCGIAYMPVDFSSCYEKLWVEHNSFDIVLDSVPNFDLDALHNVPPPNTVYRFTPRFAMTGIAERSEGAGMGAYVHGDHLMVTLAPEAMNAQLELIDAAGRQVREWTANDVRMALSLEGLPHGVFTLVGAWGDTRSAVRVVR
ncbi:MAG: hypothetical protein KA175_03315 [Flavobacteriales bacterium]|nr:hypothetical protein [Flavobacteriales bacterium]MBP6696622.1 hypothetical protein [Flavobacteriales bacterium]